MIFVVERFQIVAEEIVSAADTELTVLTCGEIPLVQLRGHGIAGSKNFKDIDFRHVADRAVNVLGLCPEGRPCAAHERNVGVNFQIAVAEGHRAVCRDGGVGRIGDLRIILAPGTHQQLAVRNGDIAFLCAVLDVALTHLGFQCPFCAVQCVCVKLIVPDQNHVAVCERHISVISTGEGYAVQCFSGENFADCRLQRKIVSRADGDRGVSDIDRICRRLHVGNHDCVKAFLGAVCSNSTVASCGGQRRGERVAVA